MLLQRTSADTSATFSMHQTHQDIKPDNILMLLDGRLNFVEVSLADCGTAKHFVDNGVQHTNLGTDCCEDPVALAGSCCGKSAVGFSCSKSLQVARGWTFWTFCDERIKSGQFGGTLVSTGRPP